MTKAWGKKRIDAVIVTAKAIPRAMKMARSIVSPPSRWVTRV